MDANITWDHGMSFSASSDSGFIVPLGTSPKVGGENDGFKPMELMAISLGGCTAMDVISILRKKRQDITAYKISVHTETAETHPKVFTSATILYKITGHNVDEKAVRRAIQLSADRYCPAQGMLDKVMPIKLDYEIYESQEKEEVLIQKGTYKRD